MKESTALIQLLDQADALGLHLYLRDGEPKSQPAGRAPAEWLTAARAIRPELIKWLKSHGRHLTGPIWAPAGVGTKLKELLDSLQVVKRPGCKCNSIAQWMNTLGIQGVKDRRDEVLSVWRKNAEHYKWYDWIRPGYEAAKSGLAFRLNLLDPFPGLLDEAIARAEAHRAESPRESDLSSQIRKTAPAPQIRGQLATPEMLATFRAAVAARNAAPSSAA